MNVNRNEIDYMLEQHDLKVECISPLLIVDSRNPSVHIAGRLAELLVDLLSQLEKALDDLDYYDDLDYCESGGED